MSPQANEMMFTMEDAISSVRLGEKSVSSSALALEKAVLRSSNFENMIALRRVSVKIPKTIRHSNAPEPEDDALTAANQPFEFATAKRCCLYDS